MDTILSINHISHSYHTLKGETPALYDISFSVNQGEFLAVVGPSGCGKSTLLSLISGLLQPEKGEILLHGKPIEEQKDKISVFPPFRAFRRDAAESRTCPHADIESGSSPAR